MPPKAKSEVLSLLRGNPEALALAPRDELLRYHDQYRDMTNEWLRRMILQRNRIDVLASIILGYQVQPFHRRMLWWQFQHPDNLILCYRGAGKTTICTVVKAIHLLLQDPNLRLVIVSKSFGNAAAMLAEIKRHFETNELLAEVFGRYYDSQRVDIWSKSEINTLARTRWTKEANITAVGYESTVVSKHYDVCLDDDLVNKDNARTKLLRDGVRDFYYQTLRPCLEPPDPSVPHRGEHHREGTRWHYDDLYGHLQKNELKDHTLLLPAEDEQGRILWPEKHTREWLDQQRKDSGLIIYDAQFKLNTKAMEGEVFQYDDCQEIDDAQVPTVLRIFMGVDLAITEDEQNDQFAIVVIGEDQATGNIYVLDAFSDWVRFTSQTDHILRFYRRHDPVLAAIETNAYQAAKYHDLKDEDRDLRLLPVQTDKDKVTRAWKLTPFFEGKRVFFRRGGNMAHLIDQLVMFPNHEHDDLFDAFALAMDARAHRVFRRRKPRENEPGIIGSRG